MILPITSFSPGGEPDFRAEGPDSPQANVLHNCESVCPVQAARMKLIKCAVRGSWKSAGLR